MGEYRLLHNDTHQATLDLGGQHTMQRIPKLQINLCERLQNGFRAFGVFDLTAAAAVAIDDHEFDDWESGYIPASTPVCLVVSHEARTAAMEGLLFSYDLKHVHGPFLASVGRFGGASRLIEYLAVRDSARSVTRQAERLLERVREAEFVDRAAARSIAHPLTEEVGLAGDGIPFAFVGMEAVWRGVDPRELLQYTAANGGEPDAYGLLASFFAAPEDAVGAIDELDDAVHAFRLGADGPEFKRWVSDWNAKQAVRIAVSDDRRAVGLRPDLDKNAALAWCVSHLEKARQLESSIDGLYVHPVR
jgi:hypothetical protein